MSNHVVIQSHNVTDIERMARAFASSKLFGVSNPEQAVALCLIAQAEGRHPASAAQDYHIIQGRPSKKADAMLRDFLSAGGKVEWHRLDDQTADATFTHSSGGSVRISWDMDRAKKAKITNPIWNKYPRQMLRARTVSEGVRTVFPMATSGMYVPEEVTEFEETKPAPVIEDPPQQTPKAITDQSRDSAKNPSKDTEARTVFMLHQSSIRQAESRDDLREAWRLATADKDRIPVDWQRDLRAEVDSKLAEITAAEQQANAEENNHGDFPFGENPPAPTNLDAPINPEDFLKDLEADMEMAIDEDAVIAVWHARTPEDALEFPPDLEKARQIYDRCRAKFSGGR